MAVSSKKQRKMQQKCVLLVDNSVNSVNNFWKMAGMALRFNRKMAKFLQNDLISEPGCGL